MGRTYPVQDMQGACWPNVTSELAAALLVSVCLALILSDAFRRKQHLFVSILLM